MDASSLAERDLNGEVVLITAEDTYDDFGNILIIGLGGGTFSNFVVERKGGGGGVLLRILVLLCRCSDRGVAGR